MQGQNKKHALKTASAQKQRATNYHIICNIFILIVNVIIIIISTLLFIYFVVSSLSIMKSSKLSKKIIQKKVPLHFDSN